MKRKFRTAFILILAVVVTVGGYLIYHMARNQAQDKPWIADLGYQDSEVYGLTFNWPGDRSCPQIPVEVGDSQFEMMFDTGCAAGIVFTNAMEQNLSYTLLGQTEQLNRDGFHRGWSNHVSVDAFTVFGQIYSNVETTICDWSMISSQEFNGCIGLAYFDNRSITLDYHSGKIAVGDQTIDYDSLPADYAVLDMYHSKDELQSNLVFVEAELDGAPAMVYIDTGKNYSYLYDENTSQSVSQSPAVYTDGKLIIGGIKILLEDVVSVNDIAQAKGLPYPTKVELNSDQIWKNHLVVTFDMIEQKVIISKQ